MEAGGWSPVIERRVGMSLEGEDSRPRGRRVRSQGRRGFHSKCPGSLREA